MQGPVVEQPGVLDFLKRLNKHGPKAVRRFAEGGQVLKFPSMRSPDIDLRVGAPTVSLAPAPAGNVVAFAGGGVVNQPTLFPLSGGSTGLTGEAGPEGILPLRRGADGRLGVSAASTGGGAQMHVHNVFHVSGPIDRRSQEQISAAAYQAVQRAAGRYS